MFMKKIIVLHVFLMLVSVSSFSQKKTEINYTEAFQIDSSEFYLIPELIDGDNRNSYGKIWNTWGNYSNVHIYDAKNNTVKKVFDKQTVLIETFFKRDYYQQTGKDKVSENLLPDHIVYLVRTDNFNKDNTLDNDDPAYLFISKRSGDSLTQITPNSFHVMSWTLSVDKKMILVRGKFDKNGNKKFGNGDDDSYYRIDLNDDISKIKCYPIYL